VTFEYDIQKNSDLARNLKERGQEEAGDGFATVISGRKGIGDRRAGN